MGTRIPLSKVDTEEKDLKDKLEMSAAEIGLSVRTTNCLEDRGIFTVNDLLHSRPEDLLAISNFGEKTLEEVGEKFGVTRERVRQIQNLALRKLRKMIEKLETSKNKEN